MSFNRRDIVPGMDVYTFDNAYLGMVYKIDSGPASSRERGPAQASSYVSGELLGPMPTLPLGNSGPRHQSASDGYGTASDAEALGAGTLLVGRWRGLLGRRVIPIADVLTVSLERVVLRQRKAELG
jgi:hypothetical protein